MTEIRIWLEYVGKVIHQTTYRKNCVIDCIISDREKNLDALRKKLSANGIILREGSLREYYVSSQNLDENSVEEIVKKYSSELQFSSRKMGDNELGPFGFA